MNNVNEYMRINEEFNIFLENINFSLIKKNGKKLREKEYITKLINYINNNFGEIERDEYLMTLIEFNKRKRAEHLKILQFFQNLKTFEDYENILKLFNKIYPETRKRNIKSIKNYIKTRIFINIYDFISGLYHKLNKSKHQLFKNIEKDNKHFKFSGYFPLELAKEINLKIFLQKFNLENNI